MSRPSLKKADATGWGVQQIQPAPREVKFDLSNSGQVIQITADVHVDSEEDGSSNIESGAESGADNNQHESDTGSAASSENFPRTGPTSPLNPDPLQTLYRGKTSYEVWSHLELEETDKKKGKLSGSNLKLITAARMCDSKSTKKILEEHADLDLDCTDKIGQAAIHYAADEGHVDILRLLVEDGAKIDTPDKHNGKTALHHAVDRNQIKAAEYLILAGANLTVKDMEGKTPYDLCKSEKMRLALSNLWSTSAEKDDVPTILAERNEIHEGSKTKFKKLGLVVEYSNNGKGDFFTMMCRRKLIENSGINFGFQKTEEVLSDVFVYRIGRNAGRIPSIVTVTLFSGPEPKEEVVIRTNKGNEFVAIGVKEKKKKWTCKFKADLKKFSAFVAVCRPKRENFEVGTEATTVHSMVDGRVKIIIPENAFDEPTKVTMEITEPTKTISAKTKEFKDIVSATSFYSIISEGGKPNKSFNVLVPLPNNYKGNGRVVILSMDRNEEEKDENSWSILNVEKNVIDDGVVLNVASSSVNIVIEAVSLKKTGNDIDLKRQVSQLFRTSRQREHSVVFLLFLKRIEKTNTWKLAIECCQEDKASDRQKYWENETYKKQGGELKDQIVALPKEKYQVKLIDAIKVVGASEDVILEFHPKRNNFQRLIIQMKEEKSFVKGKLDIIQLPSRPGMDGGYDKPDIEKLLTSLEFELDKIAVPPIPGLDMNPKEKTVYDTNPQGFTPTEKITPIFSSTSDFLNDNQIKQLMAKLADEWFPVLILMGISFSELENVLTTQGDLRNKLVSLALNWRDKSKGQEHLGVPDIVSALAKGGAFALSRSFCADLKKWHDNQMNQDDVFYKWLEKAYSDNNLLNPGDYNCPMSDSYLAIISTHLEPSFETASALHLTKEEHTEVLADKAFINNRLKVMKLLVIFRKKSPSLIKGLENLILALEMLNKPRPKKWAIMCASAWVKRTANPKDPFRTQVDELMKKLG
ncbi:hypothetical protein CHS0354_030283 [Potamilus streckersoni]|uniref:Uncharacterized protein n=1 Tax=Potamilus streckersoni TaxID=2493646 RepID=A0AAE0VJ27_9BIVA|nr:hypothetical protein CHS0354_030283 [Potamilus streckersoni]